MAGRRLGPKAREDDRQELAEKALRAIRQPQRQPQRRVPGVPFGSPGHPPELGALYAWQKGQSGNLAGPPSRKRIHGALKAAILELGSFPMPPHWRKGDKDIERGATNDAVLATLLRRGAGQGDRFCIEQILKLQPAEVVMDVDFTEVDIEDRMDALAEQETAENVPGKAKPNGSNGAGQDHHG